MFILTKSNISLWLKQSHHGPNLIVAACTWLQHWKGDFKPVGTQNTPADWGPVLTLPRNSAPSLCFTAAGAFWEKQCDHNGSVLPSLHTLPSLHHLLGLKAALQSFKVIPLPQGTKGHDDLLQFLSTWGKLYLNHPDCSPRLRHSVNIILQ